MSDRDWFRAPTWNPETAAEFERRLGRARADNRAQYVYIQGATLTGADDEASRAAGRALLGRVAAEYPDSFHAVSATEQLGHSLADDGQVTEALAAFERTLAMIAASPIGRSGTTHATELTMAELLLSQADPDLDRVADLLAAIRPVIESSGLFRQPGYRFALASARVASRRGEADEAARQARRALDLLDDPGRPITRHPTLGWATATRAERRELERLIRG